MCLTTDHIGDCDPPRIIHIYIHVGIDLYGGPRRTRARYLHTRILHIRHRASIYYYICVCVCSRSLIPLNCLHRRAHNDCKYASSRRRRLEYKTPFFRRVRAATDAYNVYTHTHTHTHTTHSTIRDVSLVLYMSIVV